MQHFERTLELACSQAELFAWHARGGAFTRLEPAWSPLAGVRRSGGLEVGAQLELVQRLGPLRLKWVAQHTAYDPPHSFSDRQLRGPFAHWEHEHRCEALGARRARLCDRVRYRLPLEPLSRWLAGAAVEQQLDALFRYRHTLTRFDLERWSAARRLGPGALVELEGAQGAIGKQLAAFLDAGGCALRTAAEAAGGELQALVWLHTTGDQADFERLAARARALAACALAPRAALVLLAGQGAESSSEGTESELLQSPRCAAASEAALRALQALEKRGTRLVVLHLPRVLDPRVGGLSSAELRGAQLCRWVALEDLLGAVLYALEQEAVRGACLVAAAGAHRADQLRQALRETLRQARGGPARVSSRPAPPARSMPTQLELQGFAPRLGRLESALAHAWGRVCALENAHLPEPTELACAIPK